MPDGLFAKMSGYARKRGKKTPFYTSEYIDEMIAEERQKEQSQMAKTIFPSVKIRATHLDTGFNLEFDLLSVTITDIKAVLAELKEAQFIKTSSGGNADKKDNTGKTGVVTSVTKIEGKEQWQVMIKLDEVGAGEQRIVSFSAKEYRKGDIVKLEKNAKGYLVGTIIEDSDRPTQTDSIPF